MPEKKSFVLRISPDLFEAIQKVASDEFRSVNGQIEFILSGYVRERGRARSVESTQERATEPE